MIVHAGAKWKWYRDKNGQLKSELDKGKYIHYAVTHPTQIKSAEPVTYDDSGNIIPLSKRFDSNCPDIRGACV